MKELLFVNCYPEKREEKAKPYIEAIKASGFEGRIREIPVEQLSREYLSLKAAVISGSPLMAGQGQIPAPLPEFIRAFPKPLLGICYGHQVLAHTFGAEVRRDREKHKGKERIRLLVRDPLFEGLSEELEVEESHQEIVVGDSRLEENFKILAVNMAREDLIEAIKHRTLPYYGVQFHPERNQVGPVIFRNFLRLAGLMD